MVGRPFYCFAQDNLVCFSMAHHSLITTRCCPVIEQHDESLSINPESRELRASPSFSLACPPSCTASGCTSDAIKVTYMGWHWQTLKALMHLGVPDPPKWALNDQDQLGGHVISLRLASVNWRIPISICWWAQSPQTTWNANPRVLLWKSKILIFLFSRRQTNSGGDIFWRVLALMIKLQRGGHSP